ncbi:hypothetical protein HYT51_01520 [Candidatus Woesearchaeota archaeon]|nr:hypothetical protein [Candidatus Woesearchaeota archaeon]
MSKIINPMMYRVFLQDERDAPDPIKDHENAFRIRSGEILAWYLDAPPSWQPTLEEQLKAMDFGSCVRASAKPLDGHLLIEYAGSVVGIAHTSEELSKKVYEIAKDQAYALATRLSHEKRKLYVMIDVTSRGNPEEAKVFSEIEWKEEIEVPSLNSVDIDE